MSTENKKRVVVAMSGGVDSSVAAYLLKKQGYEVIGISLKLSDEGEYGQKQGKTCCSFEDIRDARTVCDILDIPFYAFNYKEDFKKKVIEKFVDEYVHGRTPNPCLLCNNHIKFDRLLEEAGKLGADFLATGHYARIIKNDDGTHSLLKAVDDDKDQSYVLHRLSEEALSKLLFPLGELTKPQVRLLGEEASLPTANKSESQDICFIPDRDHAKFIKKNYPDLAPAQGNFVNQKGEVLGIHEGIHKYTVGQRRGLGIGFGDRIYVTKIDVASNRVFLGTKEEVLSDFCLTKEVHWINPSFKPKECGVKIRYQKDEIPAQLNWTDDDSEVKITFLDRAPAVTPGQSAVFYLGDKVVGGGIIHHTPVEKPFLI